MPDRRAFSLEYAHGQGFIHRDIKPANLLVLNTGQGEQAKLADFGLARTYQESPLSGLTLSGTAAGTPQFMPPEQITDFRSARPAADQYSAAATLYYLLTGHHAYDGNTTAELFRKKLTEEPVPLARQTARFRRNWRPPCIGRWRGSRRTALPMSPPSPARCDCWCELAFAAFGKVVKGMEVVKKINAGPAKEQTLTPPVRILGISRKSEAKP